MTVEFCYLFFISVNFYFNAYFNVPKYLNRKKYFAFAGLFVSGIVITALLRVPLATFLNRNYFLKGLAQPGFQKIFFNSLVNIFIWTVTFVAAKLVIDRVRFRKYIDSVENEKTKNELEFLRAQFNPHFLFNSLNSIYGNIDKRNSTAREMLLTFSEMLRYQLYECNTNLISIDKEINYLRNYVALQESRKPENLAIHLEICEDVKGVAVAPLLFTAFIENAFKYVSHHDDKANEVSISLSKQHDHVVFRAFNTKENFISSDRSNHNGIGIANVRRRLELLYPQKHELTIKSSDSYYEAKLSVQV
jgi:LytS/YehU family sensor histidine kinase